jgi:ATP-binding protein involved in chromosome partitioning
MMGIAGERPTTTDGKTLDPPRGHGLPVMSIGFLVDADQPMVWRGPMVTQALTQMLADTRWGVLDYLVVDMPPGTGDIQLTLTQRVPVSGAVIVTTPQEIALLDARKGLQMFRKVGVPVLGIVENMGLHRCPSCGHVSHVFDAGGGAALAEKYAAPLLGQIPLDALIREQADSGKPTVVAEPSSANAALFHQVARHAAGRLAAAALAGAARLPAITIEEE